MHKLNAREDLDSVYEERELVLFGYTNDFDIFRDLTSEKGGVGIDLGAGD